MLSFQFQSEGIRPRFRILSIPLRNRSVAFLGKQLSQKVNKDGDFAGLTAGRGSHGADRNSGRLTIAYVGRKKPARRLGDTEAGRDRGAELYALRNDAAA